MENKSAFTIQPATAIDIPELALLFDDYRIFYKADSAPVESEAFVRGVIDHGNTCFFVARDVTQGQALGFVHLMPSINTVAMRPIWLLEDLFVTPRARGRGIASALMRYAETFARHTGAERLTLATAHDNLQAQSLYKQLGYVKEDHFWYYNRLLE
jgi:GNAT superfamily N-acetyltransferase